MPTLSQFYGVIIKMYFHDSEHHPPHFHVVFGEYEAEFNIYTCALIAGRLPIKAKRRVERWAKIHRDELLVIWENQKFHKIKPLE